jgi:hypothetical protein
MDVFGVLIALLVYALIFALIYWILGLIPLPAPAKQIATVILGIVGILILLGMLLGVAPLPRLRLA